MQPSLKLPSVSLVAEGLACERGGRRIFSDVAFTLSSGDALVIRGGNGSGKTSLLRILAGLATAASGRITLEEGGFSPLHRGGCLHYVGHRDGLKASLSAQENLSFWATFLGGNKHTAKTVTSALAAFGLPYVLPVPVAHLSAGERRRIALARLLTVQRPVWLLDEPTTGLDSPSRTKLADIINRHRAEGGLLVMTTHDAYTPDEAITLKLG
ncbi:MAG: heme ABC exporter ATP-binding protein CcmA [Parvularculales bacterium]